jgi:hypothetical protein
MNEFVEPLAEENQAVDKVQDIANEVKTKNPKP